MNTIEIATLVFKCTYLNTVKGGETKKDYYCGITNDLKRRAEEYNATFVVTKKMNNFEDTKKSRKSITRYRVLYR